MTDTKTIEEGNRIVGERWKAIKGYEGYYDVSNHGRVRSIARIASKKRVRGRIMKPNVQGKGYLYVWLNKDGNAVNPLIHRLVGVAFLKNSRNLPQINHKNGIKTDNGVWNLEWCTRSYNRKHAYSLGLSVAKKGVESHFCKLSKKDVLKIRSLKNSSNKEIAKIFNICSMYVWMIKTRKTWKHI